MPLAKQSYTQTAGMPQRERLRQREMTSSNRRYTKGAMAAPNKLCLLFTKNILYQRLPVILK